MCFYHRYQLLLSIENFSDSIRKPHRESTVYPVVKSINRVFQPSIKTQRYHDSVKARKQIFSGKRKEIRVQSSLEDSFENHVGMFRERLCQSLQNGFRGGFREGFRQECSFQKRQRIDFHANVGSIKQAGRAGGRTFF